MKEERRYSSFLDDFERSADQDYRLPDGYKWVRTDPLARFLSGLIYGLAILFGGLYCRLFLHMRVKGKQKIKGIRDGFFIYGNHTQPVGDVFIPALCALPRRIYTVVSTANYGIPIIGRLLPFLGALPIVSSAHGIRELQKAMEHHLEAGHPIVIYPEAHVWKYYTQIRPFPDTSFKFPVRFHKPVFTMTVTYRKSKRFKRPIMDVYLDGPFIPRGTTAKEQAASLHQQACHAMQERSRASTYSYITYKPLPSDSKCAPPV